MGGDATAGQEQHDRGLDARAAHTPEGPVSRKWPSRFSPLRSVRELMGTQWNYTVTPNRANCRQRTTRK